MNAWLLAIRPRTLAAALAPVAVGTAVARAARPGAAVAALAGAAFLQIGANLVNDAADAARGADGPDRLGPTRVVASGLLSATSVWRAAGVAFALAVACGLYLTAVAGPAVVGLGLASIAAAVAYTAGPYPLGYHGLGDVFVLVFFGFAAVCGTAFVQLGHVPAAAIWAAIPVGALATCLLAVNNLRDREGDARAGKRTLAVRFGRRGAVGEILVLLGAAYAVPVWIGGWAMLTLLTLPLALLLGHQATWRDGRALNGTLAVAAQLLLAHSLLFTVGLWLG